MNRVIINYLGGGICCLLGIALNTDARAIPMSIAGAALIIFSAIIDNKESN